LSGPPFKIRASTAFHRGLKSLAESGAKAPHSICGAGDDKRAPPKAFSERAASQLHIPTFGDCTSPTGHRVLGSVAS